MFLGGLFSKTEMSEVLTEILKIDPKFDKDTFLKQCEKDIIPNILEVTTECVLCLWLVHLSSSLASGGVNRVKCILMKISLNLTQIYLFLFGSSDRVLKI